MSSRLRAVLVKTIVIAGVYAVGLGASTTSPQNPGPSSGECWQLPRELDYLPWVREWDVWHQISGNAKLTSAVMSVSANLRPVLMALVYQESGFDEHAVGPTNDYGLFQLSGKFYDRWLPAELMNVDTNIKLGIQHFLTEWYRFRGSEWHALAAYNAGPAAVVSGNVPALTQRHVECIQQKADEFRKLF